MEDKDVVHKFLDLVLFNLELGLYKNNELCIQFLNYYELKKYAKALKEDYKIEDRSLIWHEYELESDNVDIVLKYLNQNGDLNQIAIVKLHNRPICFYKEHYRKQRYMKYIQYSEKIFDEVTVDGYNFDKIFYEKRHIF